MKLFTRSETKAEQQSSLDVLRAKEAAAVKALAEKIKRINDLELEYPQRLAEKEKELAELNLKLRTFTVTEDREISLLEERRKQALAPIVEELARLEDMKRQIEDFLLTLDDKRELIKKSEETLRIKENEIKIARVNLEKFQEETTAFITRQKQEAMSLRDGAIEASKALAHQRDLADVLTATAGAREVSAKRAENIAKAAMVAADQRIQVERNEQKKTDDKRQMLKIAIEVLKKKGLWDKRIATKIK